LSSQPPDEVQRGFQVVVAKERFRLPSGRELELDIVKHPGAAAIVPFISDTDVLLIRQYRHATRDTILEVPAGKIDPGESPSETAVRELEEEVGQRAGRIRS
jgi:ADP-ribose pyrophosphatase